MPLCTQSKADTAFFLSSLHTQATKCQQGGERRTETEGIISLHVPGPNEQEQRLRSGAVSTRNLFSF